MTDITLTFGKYKGQKLSEVPTDYVEWLSKQLFICGKQDVPLAARAFLKSQPAKMPRFHDIVTKGGYIVTVDEQEDEWRERQAYEDECDAALAEHRVLSWTATNGKDIEIIVWDASDILVKVGSFDEHRVEGFQPVAVSQQARAKAMGVVCQLGPVGLTAERKAVVEAAIRKFQK